MMRSRVIVNGARGKMGALACETLNNHPEFELVAALGRMDDLQHAISETHAQIVVDLTRADCVYRNTLTIIQSGAHPVIGTSGLLNEQVEQLQALCLEEKRGGLIAPNFSVAAVLMMQFAAQAARYLPDVEVIETHHLQKADAPSGTAIKTAELIAKARQRAPILSHSQELLTGARGALHQEVPIHSLRLPGILARQDVVFGGVGETLTLIHNSLDRRSFMPGVILACQRVLQAQQLYYGLEHVLDWRA